MSTLSASATGTRQLLYIGTPPYPGCLGQVFRRFRRNCIMSAGKDENTRHCWHEWGITADSLQKIDIEDKRLWYECNPALGYRLTEEFTAEEYKTLSGDGFVQTAGSITGKYLKLHKKKNRRGLGIRWRWIGSHRSLQPCPVGSKNQQAES